MAELAKALGLQKSNFLAALAGRRPLPERSLALLPERIGLDAGGGLATTQVHRWKVRDVQDLNLVLETWVTSADLRPTQGVTQPKAIPPSAWILSAHRINDNGQIFGILVGRGLAKIDGLSSAVQRGDPVAVADLERIRTVQIGIDDIQDLLTRGKDAEAQCITWVDFIRAAMARGFDPQSALRALELVRRSPPRIDPTDR